MGQGDLARCGVGVAPEQSGVAGRVMWRPEGATGDQRLTGRQLPHDAVDLGGFERLGQRQGRQDGRQTACEHGLAGAWRPDEHEVVTARRGHLEGPFHRFLSANLVHVHGVGVAPLEESPGIHLQGRDRGLAREELRGFLEASDRDDIELVHDARFGGILGGQQETTTPLGLGPECQGQGPFDRADRPRERQLAHHGERGEIAGHELFAGHEDAHGDRQIEAGPLFADVGRSQIDGGPPRWEPEAAVDDGRAHAVSRFTHGRIGQAHQDDLLGPGPRVDFDFDGEGVDSLNRGGTDLGEHGRVGARTMAGVMDRFGGTPSVLSRRVVFSVGESSGAGSGRSAEAQPGAVRQNRLLPAGARCPEQQQLWWAA